jgi:hypothetical protein
VNERNAVAAKLIAKIKNDTKAAIAQLVFFCFLFVCLFVFG